MDERHRFFYDNPHRTWLNTRWMGVPVAKLPLDLWVYQEILHETRPELIVETGSYQGGSALYLAHLCDLLGCGQVISVDVTDRPRPAHPRVTFATGNSTGPQAVEWANSHAAGKRTMVILDSDHEKTHVLAELDLYSPLVTPGQYLIVEDTNVNGHPVHPGHGPGPWEALEEWLPTHTEFRPDPAREKYLVSFNPGGYLRRVKGRV